MLAFKAVEYYKLEFMTNIDTILGHNMEVEASSFVVRFFRGSDDNLDVLLDIHKWYVVSF